MQHDKKISTVLELFQGRQGIFAKQWQSKRGYSPHKSERQIAKADIMTHLECKETYGIYPINKANCFPVFDCVDKIERLQKIVSQ